MRVKMGRIQYLMNNNLLMSFQMFLLKISTRGVLMGKEMLQKYWFLVKRL